MNHPTHIYTRPEFNADLQAAYRDDAETGGFLIGTESSEKVVLQRAISVPGIGTSGHFHSEPQEFSAKLAYALEETPGAALLGIWHTHPGGTILFSGADEHTNLAYAELLDGCLSLLATAPDRFYCCYITPDGRKYPIIVF